MTEKKLTEKGEKIRQRMIEVTSRICREEGFREATVRRIAAEAHVNIAAVRYYFGSKEELIGLALDSMMGHLENTIACLDRSDLSARERLRGYMISYIQLARKHPALFKSISRPSSQDAGDTYFVYLTLIYERCWPKFTRNVAEMTGLRDRRAVEARSLQLLSAVEFPMILAGNKADFFLKDFADPESLAHYVDLLLDNKA